MATNMAKRMVTEWGMSDKLGPLRYVSDQEEVFLGHSVSQTKNMSDETASIRRFRSAQDRREGLWPRETDPDRPPG
jgi:hypothetical protein